MSDTPAYLKDSAQLLTQAGFTTCQTWYHGTASGLVASIMEQGLKQSGDVELIQKAKNTITTIGDSIKENKEPVFLTQSKELAYFWACATSANRNKFFSKGDEPAVLSITLPTELNDTIKPDVGAAAVILAGGNDYIDALESIYTRHSLQTPKIDPNTADRMEYLSLLGMAYSGKDIAAQYIELVTP